MRVDHLVCVLLQWWRRLRHRPPGSNSEHAQGIGIEKRSWNAHFYRWYYKWHAPEWCRALRLYHIVWCFCANFSNTGEKLTMDITMNPSCYFVCYTSCDETYALPHWKWLVICKKIARYLQGSKNLRLRMRGHGDSTEPLMFRLVTVM